MDLRHNTILITGGTSGLGFEFARQLLVLGNTVLVTGRDQARLAETQRLLPGVHAFQSDVRSLAAIGELHAQVTQQFPALNVLINNAGEMRKLDLNAPTPDLADLTREIETNLLGPIWLTQQFLSHLKAQKSAFVLNVTSGIALVPYPLAPVYGASKAGLHSYTQSLRVQLRRTNVRVVELVAPAAKTPLNDKFANVLSSSDMMDVDKLIAAALKGMQHDQPTIYPGLATALRYLSRLAPQFLLKQLSKPVEQEFSRPAA